MKASEVSIVYEDGTVLRLKGLDAARLVQKIGQAFSEMTFIATTIGMDCNYKPHRKVTEVEGSLVLSWYDTEASIFIGEDSTTGIVRDHAINECLFPDEVVRHVSAKERADTNKMVYPENRAGPRCKFRITVEAIPVEEKKP